MCDDIQVIYTNMYPHEQVSWICPCPINKCVEKKFIELSISTYLTIQFQFISDFIYCNIYFCHL